MQLEQLRMAQRWFYVESGATALLVDAAEGQYPFIRHFGPALGRDADFDALAAATPLTMWGARLDSPRPPSTLPGIEPGFFGFPALSPSSPGTWNFESVIADDTPKGPRLRILYKRQAPGKGKLTQTIQAFGDSGVIGMRLTAQDWQEPSTWAAAMAVPVPASMTETLTFEGDWAREFSARRSALGPGGLILESRRGRPGHDRFPGFFLGEAGFGEDTGRVYAFTLGWSGNARLRADPMREGGTLVQLGELLLDGDEAYDSFDTPWAYATFSACGLNGAGAVLQRFVRERIIPPLARSRPRPVHYNTWEAVYFKHDMDTLRDLAERAAQAGAERFVLDDGWFKGRDNDRTSLGDWLPDAQKYPQGLTPLIEHVRALGMEFGLWVEPEMVSPDSELARANPGWLRREPDGSVTMQRHQAVLDMSAKGVSDHIFRMLTDLLSAHPISYIKWDMNRDLTGLDAEVRPGHAEYVRAVYDLIEKVRAAHPIIEIEACASGGGRMDYGMLSLTDRVWTSDSNDALDRLEIQRNASLFIPPEIMGAHVGPATCHITGRRLSLDLRAHVATFGHMGLELDLRAMPPADLTRLSQHIANYVRFRPLLHSSVFLRLSFADPDHSGLYAAEPDGDALALVARTGSARLGQGTTVRFPGLAPGANYLVQAVQPVTPAVEACLAPAILKQGARLSGQVLAGRGLDLFLPRPETSVLLFLQRQ
jgi:alpha-galactosidase